MTRATAYTDLDHDLDEREGPMVQERGWPADVPRPPSGSELPCEDGIPMESNWHRLQMNLLIDTIERGFEGRSDYFAGGNMFIYFSALQARNQDFRGPDFFVVQGCERRDRDSWVVWEEDGLLPDVIVELMSPSTKREDTGRKRDVYERVMRVPQYFYYDPATRTLTGLTLGDGGQYRPIEPEPSGRLLAASVGLELGLWRGSHKGYPDATWLRWFTPDGELIASDQEWAASVAASAEAESQRAEAESQRADALAAEVVALRAQLAGLDESESR